MWPVYQRKASLFVTIQQTIDPIPDEYAYLFRSGFLAMCYDHVGSPKATTQYAKWEEQIMTALKAADREQEGSHCIRQRDLQVEELAPTGVLV